MTTTKEKRPASKDTSKDPTSASETKAAQGKRRAGQSANEPAAKDGPAEQAEDEAAASGKAAVGEAGKAGSEAALSGAEEGAGEGKAAQADADLEQSSGGDAQAGAPEQQEAEPEQDPAAERDRLREQLLRAAADLDNYRKRARREVQEAVIRGKEDAFRELLPVFDNLERAIAAAEEAKDAGSVLEGVRMVLKLFTDTGERMGLKRVPGVGERFDPAVHEALQRVETTEHPAATVVTEVTPGYVFGERLLRPALVVVAQPPRPAQEPNAQEPGPQEPGPSEDRASAEDRDPTSSDDVPEGEAS